MKILIEISHPAHVHYFKNFIKIMTAKGNTFKVIARDKEVTFDLLRAYGINFVPFGKGKKSFIGKLLKIFIDDIKLLFESIKFNPDVYISFSSVFVGHVSFVLRKPHFVFDDTEHSKYEHLMYKPFANTIVTPSYFVKNMGEKQVRFKGFFEMCYLHPNYFKVDTSIFDFLGIGKTDKFIILRFISWDAIHDIGHKGLSMEIKRKAIEELSKYAKVFISSEENLPDEFKKYHVNIPAEKMHDALCHAELFFGESGTMAVESALLGTPSVMVSTLAKLLGNFIELQNNQELLFYYDSGDEGFEKALNLIKDGNSKRLWQKKKDILFENNIDVTAFMVWFVENHPSSIKILKDNPSYQYKFIH